MNVFEGCSVFWGMFSWRRFLRDFFAGCFRGIFFKVCFWGMIFQWFILEMFFQGCFGEILFFRNGKERFTSQLAASRHSVEMSTVDNSCGGFDWWKYRVGRNIEKYRLVEISGWWRLSKSPSGLSSWYHMTTLQFWSLNRSCSLVSSDICHFW